MDQTSWIQLIILDLSLLFFAFVFGFLNGAWPKTKIPTAIFLIGITVAFFAYILTTNGLPGEQVSINLYATLAGYFAGIVALPCYIWGRMTGSEYAWRHSQIYRGLQELKESNRKLGDALHAYEKRQKNKAKESKEEEE